MTNAPREPRRSTACHFAFPDTAELDLPRLVETARRILGSDDLAWDAVQETLVSLWHQTERPPHLLPWLLHAVVHRSLHLARTSSRRRRHEGNAARGRSEGSRRDDPLRVAVDREWAERLRRALDRLPEDYRAVYELREREQLEYRAIARRLGVPVGTVRSRLNRCRAALRELLADDDP